MENTKPEVPVNPEKKPNETGAVNVDGFLKIFDPNTKKVFTEQKA